MSYIAVGVNFALLLPGERNICKKKNTEVVLQQVMFPSYSVSQGLVLKNKGKLPGYLLLDRGEGSAGEAGSTAVGLLLGHAFPPRQV